MDHFAQGVVAGFAITTVIPAMYYFNKAALGTLFVVNRAIGKAIGRILLPPEIHTCNDEDCDREHYSCHDCDKENPKYTSPCLTTSS